MTEQEHTAGDDGASRWADSRDGTRPDESGQRTRHTWGSKAGRQASPERRARPAADDSEGRRGPEADHSGREAAGEESNRTTGRTHAKRAGVRWSDRKDQPAREESRRDAGPRGADAREGNRRDAGPRGAGARDGKPVWKDRRQDARSSDGSRDRNAGTSGGGDRGTGAYRGRTDARSERPGEASSDRRTHNARDLRSANRPDRERSPEIDEDVKGDELDRVTRAQVRNLEERSALWVSRHLVMAGRLLDVDPELAFQHALAASRRGGRLAAVREAVGLTAYAAGHYGEALREFRTFRRISGSNVHLPVMADCERGLGRPDRALDLARSEEAETLDPAGKAELAMVVSGARSDLGQLDAAVAALEIPQLDLHRAFSFSPRLFEAYADALDAVGRTGESGKWRRQARVAEKALGLDDDLEPDIIDLGEDDEPSPVEVPRVADLLGTPARGGPGPANDAAQNPVGPASPDKAETVPEVDSVPEADGVPEISPRPAESAPSVEPLQTEMLFSMNVPAGPTAAEDAPHAARDQASDAAQEAPGTDRTSTAKAVEEDADHG